MTAREARHAKVELVRGSLRFGIATQTTGWQPVPLPKIRRAAREGCPLFFRPLSPRCYGVPPAGAPPAGAPPAGAPPPPAGAASGAAGGGAAPGAAPA